MFTKKEYDTGDYRKRGIVTKLLVSIETFVLGKGKHSETRIVIKRVIEGGYYINGKKWASSKYSATSFPSMALAENKVRQRGYELQSEDDLDRDFPGWQTDDAMAEALARRNSSGGW